MLLHVIKKEKDLDLEDTDTNTLGETISKDIIFLFTITQLTHLK